MKKLLALLIVFTMVFGMATCSAASTHSSASASSSASSSSIANTSSAAGSTQKNGTAKRVMFINVMRSLSYFQNIESMVKKTCKEVGYDVTTLDVNCDYKLESDYISQAILQKYDAVMICGDQSLISSAEEAMKAGLAVINYDARIGSNNLSACVASDNHAMGAQMGAYAIELLKKKYGEVKGTILYMNYTYSTMTDRANGFKSAFEKYPNVKLVEVVPSDPDNIDESATSAENTLTAYPKGKIDIFFGPNSGTALGILSAVKSANRKDVMAVGIDDEDGQITALKDKNSCYYATIAQDPFSIGKSCVDCLESIFSGEKKGMNITVDSVLVTKDNVAEYIANRDATLKELQASK